MKKPLEQPPPVASKAVAKEESVPAEGEHSTAVVPLERAKVLLQASTSTYRLPLVKALLACIWCILAITLAQHPHTSAYATCIHARKHVSHAG